MGRLISRYAPIIIATQFAFILLLGYLLYGSYIQWEEEVRVETDTVQTTKTDTVWGGYDYMTDFPSPVAEKVMEAEADTVIRGDTLRIYVNPDTRIYKEHFTKDLVSGTITSRVKGKLLSQNVRLSLPKIETTNTQFVTKTVTKTQVGKWRIVASGDLFFGNGIEVAAPGIGLQRPTEFSVFYKYDLINGWHGGSVNVPLSLIF